MAAATRSQAKKEAAAKESSEGSKYVSLAGKTHVLFFLLTLVPFALQVWDLLPEDSQVPEVTREALGKIMVPQCYRGHRIHLSCVRDLAAAIAPTFCTGMVIILTSSSIIYGGSWRSVRSAAGKRREDAPVSMTKGDAMRFPLMGSVVLLSLFTAIKLLPKDLLTLCLGLYFMLLGTFAISATILPFVEKVLPSVFSRMRVKLGFLNLLPKSVKLFLFETDEDLSSLEITASEMMCGIASAAFCWWYHKTRHWVANNTIGLSFCMQGIEMLSLGSVQVGVILLSGLFFYDIFWVFFTPVMVTVAKSFDAPIKLLFLKSVTSDGKPTFSMLGLGDIVIPGIYLALLLRMDHKRGFEKSGYFKFVLGSYVLGLLTTLVVMHVFQHAQPALLYLVPAILGSTFLLAARKGELKFIFNYSEEEEEEEEEKLKQK
jgi:minor histocompatibility antigen H13